MIDRLNERPIHKKTISASSFVRTLENAFGSRISKTQQDAQELLQVVAERLAEEYHAGKDARKRALALEGDAIEPAIVEAQDQSLPNRDIPGLAISNGIVESRNVDLPDGTEQDVDSKGEEYGFPLEGRTEAEIECQHCHFKPKANATNFVMLNLMVPHTSSTTLNDCFDAHFKVEYIDDYTCDQCRLQHALDVYGKALFRTQSQEDKAKIREDLLKISNALHIDPEHPPEDVELPSIKEAPKRRIARHVRITDFPKILIVHLSRSVHDPGNISTKNMAKVSFPEKLPLGGLLNRRNYSLLGMVTHKGTHNNGHYEAFRRQHLYAPYSTPHNKRLSGPYSAITTPELGAVQSPSPSLPAQSPSVSNSLLASAGGAKEKHNESSSTSSSDPSISSTSPHPPSTRPSSSSNTQPSPLPAPPVADSPMKSSPLSLNSGISSKSPKLDQEKKKSSIDISRLKRKKKISERWWRISDDKIKECSTSEVLAMQKEVYMLFYEMDRGG